MSKKKPIRLTGVTPVAIFIAVALLVVSCAPGNEAAQVEPVPQQQDAHFIRVIGFGEALGQPDEAQVTVGVETFATIVSDATTENEATIAAILGSLREAGIAAEDIQTSNYSLWAEQRYGENGPEGIAGYRVSNQVMVLIRDVDLVGDVLAAVTGAGANNIYGVQFSVADPAALEADAREKALENARLRAESLARLGGLTLGEIKAVDETMGQTPGMMMGRGGGGYGGEAAMAETSISPGQLSFQVQLLVTYELMNQ